MNAKISHILRIWRAHNEKLSRKIVERALEAITEFMEWLNATNPILKLSQWSSSYYVLKLVHLFSVHSFLINIIVWQEKMSAILTCI